MTRDIYMVHCNSGRSVFVKTYDYFKKTGGFTDAWGRAWKPVIAESIEDARRIGCDVFPEARPYHLQAK